MIGTLSHGLAMRCRLAGAISVAAMAIGLLTLTEITHASARPIRLSRTYAAGVPLVMVTVDLDSPSVKVTGMVASRGSGGSEPFNRMVERSHPTAAVTGTYFSTDSLSPIGDIVVGGRLVHSGGVGTGLCLTEDNQCEFVKPRRRYTHTDWSRYDFVCCSGPRLVCRGATGVYPRDEGFHDSRLLGKAGRLAVGITAHHRLLLVATRDPIYLSKLAKAMRALGCIDAINLDAGSSLGFYYGGKTIVRPTRRLTNLILVYDDRSRYDRFKYRLSPQGAARHQPQTPRETVEPVISVSRREDTGGELRSWEPVDAQPSE